MLNKLKLAVLGDSSTQLLVNAVRKDGNTRGYDLDIFEGEFNQITHLVTDLSSDLYAFAPDVVVILFSVESLQAKFSVTATELRSGFADDQVDEIKRLVSCLRLTGEKRRIIISNFAEMNDGVYGNSSNKYRQSFLFALRRINLELMELAIDNSEVSILDIALIQSRLGRNQFFDPRLYVNASMSFSLEALPLLSRNIIDLISVSQGNARKCLILDLDNTVWGGIIGDDGVEKIEVGDFGIGKAFTRLQKWAKELKLRGILLAVCSKNSEEIAKEPFLVHPDMELKLEDFSIFVANWDDKVANIRHIQTMLNIGFDSMVFVDDNPFEREQVRSSLPDVNVPELPEDPAEYMEFLCELNLFEAGILSEMDSERTGMIQQELERKKIQEKFENQDDFLRNLEMKCRVSSFNTFNIPRVAQLSERSNQFNLRTVRYSEQDVSDIANNTSYTGLALNLEDRLGDHGLISVIVLRQELTDLFIENWFMSCRVLKRGVEQLALEEIVRVARQRDCMRIVGEYIPTKKNALVSEHYKSLGFHHAEGNIWSLPCTDFVRVNYFIERVKND